MSISPRLPGGGTDAVLVAIQERIANLTGLPHRADEVPRVALSRPWGARREAAVALQNLHHDQSQRPRRAVTLLIYLSGGEGGGEEDGGVELQGGETLFPCVTPRAAASDASDGETAAASSDGDEADGAAVGQRELCSRLEAAYRHRDGDLMLTVPGGIFERESFDPDAARAASAMCRRARTADILRVAPRRGDAVMFFNVRLDAPEVGLPHMWHGSCRVTRGEKWTLQLFKERPASE